MAFSGFDKDFPAFLKALAKNNDKKWLVANLDKTYRSARPLMTWLCDALTLKF